MRVVNRSRKSKLPSGLLRLLSEDPVQFLIYSVEQVQHEADFRKLPLVLRQTQERKEKTGWVHVSDVIGDDICDRVIAARLLGIKVPRERPDRQLERIFDNGTFMHLRYYLYFALLPPSFEVKVAKMLEQWPVVGEADIALTHRDFGSLLIELKSMNTNQFRLLKRPLPEHTAQLNAYLGLAGRERGQIWYEDKNTQSLKGYQVIFSPERFLAIQERVQAILEMVLAGRLPASCEEDHEFDETIGNMKFSEQKFERLLKEKERWQKRTQKSLS